MARKPLTMSPSYLAMARGTRELHQLIAAGKEDSPEADALRDATDRPWEALSEVERNRVRHLSEDLYSLFEPPPDLQPMNSQAQARLTEAYEAKERGEWDRALELARQLQVDLDPALISYFRGSVWLEAGDPGTAALFFRHAYNSQPENEKYLALFLHALNLADSAEARERAEAILRNHEQYSPVVVAQAADIFMPARVSSELKARQVYEFLEPILKRTLARFDQQGPDKTNRSAYLKTLSLLGFDYEFLGRSQDALECYSRGLQLEPDNDGLLVARGILLYGTSPRAISDLETAIKQGSPLVWPYVFLAHHALLNGLYEDCRKLCERALSMGGSAAVMSEVSEWLAIAQAELGYPAEMVRASFDNAIRLDPSSERARRNLAAFEAANKPSTVKNWVTRSAVAVRTSGLAERRIALAA